MQPYFIPFGVGKYSPRFGMMACDGTNSTAALDSILDWYPEVPKTITLFVHNLIDTQSKLHPESQAVCSWDGTLTYHALNNLSSELADSLLAEGIQAEVIVPLFFEKSLWAVVSMLGVMKAGGAFLMLDIAQPIGRIKAIIDQIGAKFALTSPKGLEVCNGLVERQLVVDARIFGGLQRRILGNSPKRSLEPSNAAYLIFTSGSTGNPKGVVIEHSQLATTCVYAGEQMGCDSNRRALQFASYAFDAFISDIFPTLIYGGTVCIPSDWERDNDLVDAMCRMGVNSVKITPSLASILDLEKLPTLRTLILGGESVPSTLIDKWATRVTLILVYGPTECCVICFMTDCSSHEVVPGEIGRPTGCRGWILKQGDYSQLAGIGEIGELVIEGPVVGRGYLGDVQKTEKQFIERPAWMPTGGDSYNGRLYRTGDLASYLEDGIVCYAGRIDNQVKIRGQRLELEEVEKRLTACLLTIDGIRIQQLVVEGVNFAGLSNKQLVAFLSIQFANSRSYGFLDWEDQEVPALRTSDADRTCFSALVRRLESRMKLDLPTYAVPSVWVPMQNFPYTVSKKIDRKQLRQIVTPLSAKILSGFISATGQTTLTNGTVNQELTENEIKLISICAETFGFDTSTVSLQDNFFQMGGDSLLAMRLVSVARQHGMILTVSGIVSAPTLAQLGNVATKTGTVGELPPFSLLPRADVDMLRQDAMLQCRTSNENLEDIYPCSEMQLHYVTGYPEYRRDIAGPWHWQSQQVYRLPQSVDLGRFRAVWDAAIDRHQSLRTRLILSATGIFQVVIKRGVIPSRWEHGERLQEFLEKDKSRIMSFGDELLRLAIIDQQGSSDRFFVLTMQHAIYDAFSLGMLFEELKQHYSSELLPSPPRPTMSRFIGYITGEEKSAALKFWTSYLAGSATKPLVSFPPDVKLFDLDIVEISATTKTPGLRIPGVTTATLMEVAAGLAIAAKLGCGDVVLYSDRSGRNLPVEGIQDLVRTYPYDMNDHIVF